jgi:hypothetical protein
MNKLFSSGFLGITLLAAMSARANSIVLNGDFENPSIPADSFAYFPSIPGWQLAFGNMIEIQSGIAGTPYQGSQFVELDSTASSGIYQDLATIAGARYDLSFAFSPRPGIPAIQNQLLVSWGGQTVATLGPVGGVGLENTVWTVYNYVLTASSSTTRLEFADLGPSDSFGTYIDAVSVSAVAPEPNSFALIGLGLVAAGFAFRFARKKG